MRKTNRTVVSIRRIPEDSSNERRLHTFIPTNILDKKLIDCVGFNDTATLVDHFVSFPREKGERDRRGTGKKLKK